MILRRSRYRRSGYFGQNSAQKLDPLRSAVC